MKLRPVVLVLLILSGFYYLTTRLMPVGAIAGLLHHAVPGNGWPAGRFFDHAGFCRARL